MTKTAVRKPNPLPSRRNVNAAIQRPLHRRIMLHPATMLSALLSGVLITGWTLAATGASYSVSAKVPAAALTSSAIITSPTNNSAANNDHLNVSGDCPDGSYVTLSQNGQLTGSAACMDNHFIVSVVLATGSITLLSQAYNSTDDPGPVSSGITVTYQPSAALHSLQHAPGTPVAAASPSLPAVNLTADYHYAAFTTNEPFRWLIAVDGGQPPYTASIDWGDTGHTQTTYDTAGTQVVEYHYTKPGGYAVIIRVSDTNGTTKQLQLAVFIKAPGVRSSLYTSSSSPSSTGPLLGWLLTASKGWLWVAWPAYAVCLLMLVSFWLGERQELHLQQSHILVQKRRDRVTTARRRRH